MDLTYFKRFRMEINLAGRDLTPRPVPSNYYFLPWEESLLDAFSQAKYRSFRNELDANVFPCLSEFDGCRKLMAEIVRKPGFLPEATWLVVCSGNGRSRPDYCGTVQGIRDRQGLGAIQNLGITPEHRNTGLGTSLLWHALLGFHQSGVRRVFLEVTARTTVRSVSTGAPDSSPSEPCTRPLRRNTPRETPHLFPHVSQWPGVGRRADELAAIGGVHLFGAGRLCPRSGRSRRPEQFFLRDGAARRRSRDSRQFILDLDNLGVERSEAVSTAHTSYSGATVAENLPRRWRFTPTCCAARTCPLTSWKPAGWRCCRNFEPSRTSRRRK